MSTDNGHGFRSDERDQIRKSDLAVMDANEYKQKQRLRALLDAIQNVETKANDAWDLFVTGQISHDAKNIMIQRAVKQAIRESYGLLTDHQHEKERDNEHSEYWRGDKDEPLGKIHFDDSDDVVLYGLEHFLYSREFYRETTEEVKSRRNKAPEVETETVQHSVPEAISWNAYLRLKEFLDTEHDLGLSFEELDDHLPNWGFESEKKDELPDDVQVI